jgi:hypothetical protein
MCSVLTAHAPNHATLLLELMVPARTPGLDPVPKPALVRVAKLPLQSEAKRGNAQVTSPQQV